MKSTTMKITGALFLAAALSACGTTAKSPDEWDSAAEVDVNDTISESADRAANASETLAQIERARTEPVEAPVTDLSHLPPELQRPTTVEWMGPAVELVGELARNIGYSYSVQGTEPPVDVMVSISVVDEPAVKVFENIGYQVASFANVFVDPNGKRVEFRFLNDEHAPVAGKPSKPRRTKDKMPK